MANSDYTSRALEYQFLTNGLPVPICSVVKANALPAE
jgi:hypothetical protein